MLFPATSAGHPRNRRPLLWMIRIQPPGSSLAFVGAGGQLASNAAVNTLIAGVFGGCAAMLFIWWLGPSKKPNPSMSVNGVLAGLVAITAPCAFVTSLGAGIIGLVAGVLVCLGVFALGSSRSTIR